MKPGLLWLCFLCTATSVLHAQKDIQFQLQLQDKKFIPQENISDTALKLIESKAGTTNNHTLYFLQFYELPDESRKETLRRQGIVIQDYVSANTYLAYVTGKLDAQILKTVKARAVLNISPSQKMAESLQKAITPAYAQRTAGKTDIVISVVNAADMEMALRELEQQQFEVVNDAYKAYHILTVRINITDLERLAQLPFITYLQSVLPEDRTLNINSTNITKARLLQSVQGRGLNGKDVVIGIGDDSNPTNHVDVSGNLINRSPAAGGHHGLHVMGTAAGAGIRAELYKGMAPRATIIAQQFSNIILNTPAYIQDYGMVITNNSYGNIVDDCNSFGVYDLYSSITDQQINQYPHLQHVFAAGNSGNYNCLTYTNGYSNVLGAYQSSKNAITVGNTSSALVIANGSSKGPVRDGRIKPEITAQGTAVVSTTPTNNYGSNSGTSMASPAVAGGLALLYQRYKQLHGGNNPRNGLMKTLLVNGATDVGRPGPDYAYGFGFMNLLRSVTMLEAEQYVHDSVATAQTKNVLVTVPPNTAQLKVLLYWNDPAAAPMAKQTLVNNLDLTVTTPAATVVYPQKLDTLPANVTAVAQTGVDNINNIEQVVIDNPGAGNYTIAVKGTAIAQNPRQDYFIAYDFVPVSVTATYPTGSESFFNNENVLITWDAFGENDKTFTIEYTLDNGASWVIISNNVAPALRQLLWTTPVNIQTRDAKIRITRNGTSLVSTGNSFTIINTPAFNFSGVQCEGYINVNWASVPGATGYDILLFRKDSMQTVATVASNVNDYVISGLSKDSVYWVSMRARLHEAYGQRSVAQAIIPNSGTCAASYSDNDLKLNAIISPVSGRANTSSALGVVTPVVISVKNLDNAAANNYQVKYFVNNILQATQAGVPLNALETVTQQFTVPYNFSAIGNYQLMAVVENLAAVDPNRSNDTVSVLVKHLPNEPLVITLANAFTDNVETIAPLEYFSKTTGLPGGDRYDFVSSTQWGRLRSFVNTGLAIAGNRSFTLDADRYNGGTTDSLTATFNLSGYDVNTQDLRFDFLFKHHNQEANPANKVWIRGRDTDNWLEAYDLFAQQDRVGRVKRSSSLELSNLLKNAGQQFSGSFQVRWGQWGTNLVADNVNGAGYTIDELQLYMVQNDLQLIRIDTPAIAGCALSNAVPVKIVVRNSSSQVLNNIPVKYRLNNGTVVNGSIPSIAANSSITYEFTQKADLSALGTHQLDAWVDYASDTYRLNDTIKKTVRALPLITSFPHLENFENSDGHWFATGTNVSWQYGTPATAKVKGAASGSKAWKTNLTGNYNDAEQSYLYSPCYNISGLVNPMLSMSLSLDLEDCGSSACDIAWVEYSADGTNWNKLGSFGQGKNWYNRQITSLGPLWSIQDYTTWHVASIPLPAGLSQLRLRVVLQTDPFVSREGIAIDDIHIFDKNYDIYDGPTLSNAVTVNNVSGSGWTHFTTGQQVIASVNPNGQTLGNTRVQAYINTGAVRNKDNQYYHDRNITVQPANTTLTDSVSVRFYFLDTETERLLQATSCTGCDKPASAYKLGVSKYTDTSKIAEDGSILNNHLLSWQFIPPHKVVKVPYAQGYYAEYKVKSFSEFWLNNGGPAATRPLSLQLNSFTANKAANDKDALLQWSTQFEINAGRFEIEVARGNAAFAAGNYNKLGEVPAANNSGEQVNNYTYNDTELAKSGVRYYRLKIIDQDGTYRYSDVQPVLFTNEAGWTVYPNPSPGLFNVVFQAVNGQRITVSVHDGVGKLVYSGNWTGNGFLQKEQLHLQAAGSGLYLITISNGSTTESFKVLKK
ncbi:S8 family serine peptidase [Terrimonas rubra]|uniref:S8 family serine peptidase n=1 Tax=Terrimonas rubra TaxID=1035890 RepID=A0ABW6A6B0_9BACT